MDKDTPDKEKTRHSSPPSPPPPWAQRARPSSPPSSPGHGSKPMGSHFGIGQFTTHFRLPIFVVGLNRIFTGGIWILTHGHLAPGSGSRHGHDWREAAASAHRWVKRGGPAASRDSRSFCGSHLVAPCHDLQMGFDLYIYIYVFPPREPMLGLF